MTTARYEFPLNVIHFLLDMPSEAVFWLVCTVAVLFLMVGVMARLQRRPIRIRRWWRARLAEARREQARRAVEAAELRRYADEVAVAAARAAVTAQRRRADWLTAQAEVEAAWEAFEAADAAAERTLAAAAFETPSTPNTPLEYAGRERYLRRAAMAAFWRKELTAEQLCNAMTYRNGWDPRRHPLEQEVFLRRVIRDVRLARQRAAAAREEQAWRDAELAHAAAHSLRDEAFAAAHRAEQARKGQVVARSRLRLAIMAARPRQAAITAAPLAITAIRVAPPARRLRAVRAG